MSTDSDYELYSEKRAEDFTIFKNGISNTENLVVHRFDNTLDSCIIEILSIRAFIYCYYNFGEWGMLEKNCKSFAEAKTYSEIVGANKWGYSNSTKFRIDAPFLGINGT